MFSHNTIPAMSASLRVLAALLRYPDAQLRGDLPEMRALLRGEGAVAEPRRGELERLMERLASADPLQVESDYVEIFDRGRATSLHLFEHVHGDSRDRGPALIDLGQTYGKAGLVLGEGELPDFLPVVMEFVSTQPPREARAFLGEMAHILGAIFSALQRRDSDYAGVLGALIELAGEKVPPPVQQSAPPPEESLDESWSEPPAFDGCSTKGQARPDQAQAIRIVRKNNSPKGAPL